MSTEEAKRVIIVGGGISGLTCANAVLECGGVVTLIDKSHTLFPPIGNSSFSMSGINGCQSRVQKSQSIGDDLDTFMGDVIKNGGKKTELMEVLCSKSGGVINWLQQKFGIGFVLSRSGGHTKARTHKARDRCTGFAVTSKLAEKLMHLEKTEPERVQILLNASVSQLLVSGDKITGIEYLVAGHTHKLACAAVVLATGGYGSDFNTSTSLIARFRPDLIKLSTACTLSSTGDGIKLAEHIGAKTVDMMYVQVNPTGLVDPADPVNRVKVIASESLRGDGGIIIDRHGNRFVNEVAKRDFLSSELMKNPNGPFRIILNSKTAKHVSSYIEDYLKNGLMRLYPNSAALAAEMLIPKESLAETFSQYNEAAKIAHESSVPDKFGKLHFRNHPFGIDEELTVGIIEPTIAYSVGGLAINTHANVLGRNGEIILGLFAAGEVTGGVHSCSNPMVGNDLLDCLVFGRISGIEASKYLYGPEFVDRHTNPEVIAAELEKEVKGMKQKIFDLNREKENVRVDIENMKKANEEDVVELNRLCSKIVALAGDEIPELSSLCFNPNGRNLDEMLGVENAKNLALSIRLKRRQGETEIESAKSELVTFKDRMGRVQEEIEQGLAEKKKLNARKNQLETELEKLRNSSSLVREIHELETELNELKARQVAAETAKKEEEEKSASWVKEQEAAIAAMNKKKEETYVMIQIDRIEAKKAVDELKREMKKFASRFDREKDFSEKSLLLAEKENFPIFQRPVFLPPTIE